MASHLFEGGDIQNLSIFSSAQYGDLQQLKRWIEDRAKSVNCTDPFGYTALHYAAQANHVPLVRYLLQRGADPLAADCGATPLHRAAFNGHLECCRLLVTAAVKARRDKELINLPDLSFGDGRTALLKAASQGHVAVVELLISQGAAVNAVDKHGKTYTQLLDEAKMLNKEDGDRQEASPSAAACARADLQHTETERHKNEDGCRVDLREESASSTQPPFLCPLCEDHFWTSVRLPCCQELVCDHCLFREVRRGGQGRWTPCKVCKGKVVNGNDLPDTRKTLLEESTQPAVEKTPGSALSGLFDLRYRT